MPGQFGSLIFLSLAPIGPAEGSGRGSSGREFSYSNRDSGSKMPLFRWIGAG